MNIPPEGNNGQPPREVETSPRDASEKLMQEYKILTDKWCEIDNITKQNKIEIKRLELLSQNTVKEAKRTYLEEQIETLRKDNLSLYIEMREIEDKKENILIRIDKLYPEKSE